jgi:WD40 repeat protein
MYSVRTWDIATGKPLVVFDTTAAPRKARDVAFSPDGAVVASSIASGRVLLWDAVTGQPRGVLSGGGSTKADHALIFTQDGMSVVSHDRFGFAAWDQGTGRPRFPRVTVPGEMPLVTVAAHGGRLAGASGPRATLWDLRDGKSIAVLKGHRGPILHAVFSPDGRRLATAGNDGSVRLWDAATGAVAAVFARHSSPVSGVAFSPDGKSVASAASRRIFVWDAKSGQVQASLSPPSGGDTFYRLSFAPDGKSLVSQGRPKDLTIDVWDVLR